jgi:hypothetical protein
VSTAQIYLRPELPELPRHMQGLPVDDRGYPIPWFAAWLDDDGNQVHRGEGKADFRVLGGNAVIEAVREKRCWICGGRLGKFKAFVIGPMCAINLVNSEPPSHVECADFAGRACPFLSRPHARRREVGMPEGVVDPAGIASLRNPKACLVWIIRGGYGYHRTTVRDGATVGEGLLFDLPEPHEVRWYAEGRKATVAEIEESVAGGLPELEALAQSDEERAEIAARVEKMRSLYLPKAA